MVHLRNFKLIQQLKHLTGYTVSRACASQRLTQITALTNNATTFDLDAIEQNVILRQHNNNVPIIRDLVQKLEACGGADKDLQQQLHLELNKLPNAAHARLKDYGDTPKELFQYKPQTVHNPPAKYEEFSAICKSFNLLRMEHLGNYTGHKSYYLFGALATLEHALIKFALEALKEHNFELMSVPDILPSTIIESCGMQTVGDRTQVYKLDNDLCLSGTSEMALAGFFKDKIFEEKDLPLKVNAVSRCFRAETSGLKEEKGIYRVHQFTKVEMFALCTETQSETMIESFKEIEMDLFQRLELNFRLLDMPLCELGAPAYQKYDIEAWMPGRKMWGEISSCSNCTDYQAKRLNIRYRTNAGELKFVHTVNGTAAAIPRLIIAIIESNQLKDSVRIPSALSTYFKDKEIKKNKNIPVVKLVKHIKLRD